jgi:hypothetical protein
MPHYRNSGLPVRWVLERLEQVVGSKQTGAEVCLDLEGIFPVNSLDPASYFNDVAMREESHCTGINARNADRTGFALCDISFRTEVFWASKKNPEVVCVWGRRTNRGNTITRLELGELAFALDALRSPTIVTFLLEVRKCT